ncbi:MAG TPA: maleylpyruvate isomerase N-terminal domain-containing protein [Acidimicrobiales bacterium]|nr:maleylpyruvate isomerase N-terminal domain-containing protein [Acidimicrobiales bacterium]
MTGDGNQRSAEPVVEALAEVWASLAEACEGLAAGDWDRPTDCPGWTVRDQLSHVIGIERTLLGDPAPELEGPVPGHVRNPIGQMNEAWVDARRRLPGPEVLAELRSVAGRRLEQLAGFGPERFDAVGWSPVGEVPYRDFMTVRVFDCWVHEQDVRAAVGRPGGRGGAGEAITLARVDGFLGYVLGRKVGAPEGTTAVWEVAGPLPRRIALAVVDGRARPVDPPTRPTAGLALEAAAYWRLACGRTTAGAALDGGAVTVTGDPDLARRLLESMNVLT